MASSAPTSTLLENLPARPPTPPRDTTCKGHADAPRSLGPRPSPLNPRLNLQTPPNANSPALSTATNSTNPDSSRLAKRVLWSAHTEYRDPPDYRSGEKLPRSSPCSAPPSATTKPLKGILKPSSSPNPHPSSLVDRLDGSGAQVNISEMLDSTIKQLTGPDRTSKLDAYMVLSQALKASNNLPDRVALQHRMSLFVQFIQRDVTSKKEEDGTPDTSLVKHALTLLATFLHFHAIASTIPPEFGIFITDYAIRAFEDKASTKDVVRHFMQVVAIQNFSPKVMTADRVGRLVSSLHSIEDHMKGKSVITGRLHIYRKLVKQSRGHMALHTDWLEDMFTDMLSTIREIQMQAIHLGMEAGFALRQANQPMRRVAEILQTPSDGDELYVDFYTRNLREMVQDKQRSAAVPQIWSAVTLFLRCPLDAWNKYGPWFSLIQTAFNTSDGQTKQEANYAWNRYAYLCLVDNRPTEKLLSTLRQPLISQLRRKTAPKQSEESKRLRRTVISGACNLYYYAFRPTGERDQSPDLAWDVTVQPVIAQMIGLDGAREAPTDDVLQASRILVGLLDVSTPIVWREDRIVDLPPVNPDDLPSIDSKWIRKNSGKVFRAVGPILEKKFTDLANKDSLTHRLWQAVVGSVAAASAKDIKVSEDTAGFFACAFGLLSRVWDKGCPESEDLLRSKFYPSTRNFIEILASRLGLLPFMEKKLSMTVSNTFEPVATPSHRPDKPRGLVRTPLQHLFTMLSSIPRGGDDDEAFSDFFQSVFEPFFVGKSDKIRLDLTRELLRLLPENTLSPYALWALGAQAVQLSLPANPAQTPSGSDKVPGPEFREIVSFLERGLTSHPNLPVASWLSLFDAFSRRVTDEYGDAGRAIVVLEPLAKTVLGALGSPSDRPSPRMLEAARTMFESATLPRDRQALGTARRKIWGVPASLPKAGSSDPFDSLYKLGNQVSRYYYDHYEETDTASEAAAAFVKSMGGLAVDSFTTTGFEVLSRLEDGLALWFQDEKGLLKLGNDSPLSTTIRDLWTKICTELERHGHLDRSQFDLVEGLLTSAFKSKHRFIVNRAAEAWNVVVKDQESIECSDSLKSTVSSLRPQVDLLLPGSEEPSGELGAQATSFVDSQEDADPGTAPSGGASRQAATPSPSKAAQASAAAATAAPKRLLETTPDMGRTRGSKRVTRSSRNSTPRLRHDNSQIHFEPIASPALVAEESQHLTERQQEVRERQRQEAAMYSDMRRSSPTMDADTPAEAAEAATAKAMTTEASEPAQETTPQRATSSYGGLISSTPTPRRGQVLPMDGENDPPSSPPDPRPYLLLSEIRSRSRASSLENWNFSSPPSSPVTSRQQDAQEAELPQITLTNDSTQAKAGAQHVGRTTRSGKKRSPPADVVPSSIPERTLPARKVSTRASKAREASHLDAPQPATPPPKRGSGAAGETHRSTVDEFVDARSSVERSSPVLPEMPPAATEDTSYALTDGDESQYMKFFVELESKREKEQGGQGTGPVMECITVQTDSPSPVRKDRAMDDSELASPSPVPSTQAESTQEDAEGSQGDRRRKRKRGGARSHESRRRKRRSMEPRSAAVEDVQSSVVESSPVQASGGVRTRRSTRQLQRQGLEEEGSQRRAGAAGEAEKEEGDTDEEVLSQLMTESNAASNSQTHETQDMAQVGGDEQEVAMESEDHGQYQEEKETEKQEEDGEPKKDAGSILASLRGGLEGLRRVSLSRTEVYEIEDMLMDMKRELFEAERRGRQSV